MNALKKYFVALKDNTDDIRKKTLVAGGTLLTAIVAGIVLSKLSEDRMDVIVIQENRPEEFLDDESEDPNES